jgi:pimeloyl-ACP methyl ester carboxylesterase
MVSVDGGQLGGWVTGSGAPVLLIHGGPGLNFDYLEAVADDIGEGYQVAAYQQRGLAPSMTDGPFDIATHLSDVAAVLDVMRWQMAYLVGHSWGGHLVFHLAVAMPDRLLGGLAVDPLGAVGDGGSAKFEAEMMARCPEEVRARAEELDQAALAGEGSDEAGVEGLRLYWPAYFADWDSAPPMPITRMSVAAYSSAFESLKAHAADLEARLPSISVPIGILAGGRSPMPLHESAELTAERIPGAWVEVVPGAGHFPWFERPGCVRAALDRLAEG